MYFFISYSYLPLLLHSCHFFCIPATSCAFYEKIFISSDLCIRIKFVYMETISTSKISPDKKDDCRNKHQEVVYFDIQHVFFISYSYLPLLLHLCHFFCIFRKNLHIFWFMHQNQVYLYGNDIYIQNLTR